MQDWSNSTLWSELAARADEKPAAPFLVAEGVELTRGQVKTRAARLAIGLLELGIVAGQRVGVHAANRVEHLELLFALNAIGAVYCPVHPDLRGSSLEHVVRLLELSAVFVDQERSSRWRDDALPVVALDDMRPAPQLPTYEQLMHKGELAASEASTDGAATALILMTSGTTGRSKGVELSSQFALSVGEVNVRAREITAVDRVHTAYSFCHTNPHCFTLFPVLVAGASMAWSPRFSVSRFWQTLGTLEATQFSLFTAPMLMLLNREGSPDDSIHGATSCLVVGTPRGRGQEFEDRFGVRIVEGYGMTECGAITFQPADRRLESAGKPVPEWEVRVVDATLQPVAPGVTGEIVGRPLRPGMLMNGYFKNPSATLEAYRDLWFHTNDSGYFDSDGFLWYVGRTGDVIRYRGENISALDVEETVRSLNVAADVAAVAVPAELGEDELMLVLESPQSVNDAAALYERLARELPSFCLPSHIRFVQALPRNVTGRVVKGSLKQEGVTHDTWSRAQTRTSR